MIDELIQYIKINPDVNNETTILGDEIRRTNRVKLPQQFNGYNDFLGSKVPQTVTSNPPSPNAWHKRRETTLWHTTPITSPCAPKQKCTI